MAVMRMLPAVFEPSSLTAATSASISSKRGARVSSNRSPASVGSTLRVVRVSNRTPIRVSRSRIVWLSADWDTPILAAARVKLRSRATAMKARRSLMESRDIEVPDELGRGIGSLAPFMSTGKCRSSIHEPAP